MKRKSAYFWLCLFASVCYVLLSQYEGAFSFDEIQFSQSQPITTRLFQLEDDAISLGVWNMQIFGTKKAMNQTLMDEYVDIITNHDIFVVQEIRDKSGVAFETLCDELRNYSYVCLNSSRAGRSSSKEQYGVLYRDNLEVIGQHDYNPSYATEFERPPFEVTFHSQSETFTIATIHTKPDDVANELERLDKLFAHRNKTIILGDLNADCSYYKPGTDFPNWLWVVSNEADTTVGNSDCAYDRIIMSPDLSPSYNSQYGITKENIVESLSDHYPLWVSLLV